MNRIFASLLLVMFCAISFFAPLASSAAPITVPTGLNPGDQCRLAFAISTTRDATSSDIADYNAFATTAANSVPELLALGTTWKAIASTSSIDAQDNTGTNPNVSVGVPVFNLADEILADDNANLWDGNLYEPVLYAASGDLVDERVWSGTCRDGTASTGAALGTTGSAMGDSRFSHSAWVAVGPLWSEVDQRVYGLSDVLTVVPEPM